MNKLIRDNYDDYRQQVNEIIDNINLLRNPNTKITLLKYKIIIEQCIDLIINFHSFEKKRIEFCYHNYIHLVRRFQEIMHIIYYLTDNKFNYYFTMYDNNSCEMKYILNNVVCPKYDSTTQILYFHTRSKINRYIILFDVNMYIKNCFENIEKFLLYSLIYRPNAIYSNEKTIANIFKSQITE